MKKRSKPMLVAAIMAGIAAPATAQQTAQDTAPDQPATGQIIMDQTDAGYTIAALVTGQAAAKITAELSIEKKDSAGQISSLQGGEMTLAPGQTETLAQSAISLGSDGQINVILTLSQNGVAFDKITQSVTSGTGAASGAVKP